MLYNIRKRFEHELIYVRSQQREGLGALYGALQCLLEGPGPAGGCFPQIRVLGGG